MGIIKILFSLVALLIFYKLVIKTLLLYVKYKRRYGDQIIIKFYPILGILGYFKNSFKKYGDTYHFFNSTLRQNPNAKGILYLGGMLNTFILLDNEWIKKFYQDQMTFLKSQTRFASQYLILDGLANVEGNKWKYQRNFVNSSFHYNSLLNRVPMMKETMIDFEDGLVELNEFQKIDVVLQTQKVISEIAVKSFFGQSFKRIMVNGKLFAIELTDLITEIISYRANIFFAFKAAIFGAEKATHLFNTKKEKSMLKRINDLTETANQIIEARLKQLSEIKNPQDIEVMNFLDLYIKQYLIQIQDLKSYESLNDDEKITKRLILHQFFSFTFAGTETTSTLGSMALYQLSRNPGCLEKIKEELKSNDISYEKIQVNQLQRLNYLNCFIQETLRLHPVVHMIKPRRILQDYTNGDLFIDKDLIINVRLVSQDITKPILKDITEFRPERFQENNQIDPYDFIPFSSGARNCIGQHMALLEVKLLIIFVLEKYDIRPIDNYKLKNKSGGVFAPYDPFMMMIKKKKL